MSKGVERLKSGDKGLRVRVEGHWSGDFEGMVRYGGMDLAIIVDGDGKEREICYMEPVRFFPLPKRRR